MDRKFIVGMVAAVLAVGALGYTWMPRTAPESGTGSAPSADPGSLTGEQIARLGIQLERAVAADTVPLGTVPGQVSLPPQARVAVSAPFRGVALRVLVLEGEQVVRGQPLAIVRAAEPVQFGAEMKRAQADLGFERARAERLALLAREGVVAGARAD